MSHATSELRGDFGRLSWWSATADPQILQTLYLRLLAIRKKRVLIALEIVAVRKFVMKHILISILAVAIEIISSSCAFALPSPTFRMVALQGGQAPGLPNGAVFSRFNTPSINNSGQVAFTARVIATTGIITEDNNFGAWSEGAGPLALLVREGDPAPVTPATAIYGDYFAHSPTLDNSGKAVWLGSYHPTPTTPGVTAIWSGSVGAVAPLAVRGMQPPGLPISVRYDNFNVPMVNSQGQIGFTSSLVETTGDEITNSQAIWFSQAGSLSMAVRTGDQAPGTPVGNNFQTLANLRLNESGQIAFSATLNVDVGTMLQTGVWSTANDALEVVTRAGIQATDTPVGALFNFFTGAPAFNSAGQVAFRASLVNSPAAGVDATNNEGVWSQGSGNLALVARKGDQAPQTPSGSKFNRFNSVYLNNSGQTTLLATLEQDPSLGINSFTDDGIWSDASGGLSLVVREGNQAPGVPTGVVFRDFFSLRGGFGLSFNDFGHFACKSSLTGSGVTNSNDFGLWAQDATGMLRLVVREGDLFEVRPGDERTILEILLVSGSGGSDGLARSFNNRYELAFQLYFTDNTSGIFTAQVSVPEPAAFLLATFAVGGVVTRRERRG